jgi:hypothetical protein
MFSTETQDSLGSDLQKAFQEESAKADIVTESIAFSRQISQSEAKSVFQSLQRLQYRHVYVICYIDQIDVLLTEALDLGVVGSDYLYMFPSFDIYMLKQNLKIREGTLNYKCHIEFKK